MMDSAAKSQNLFEVFLRLRPPHPGAAQAERILNVQDPEDDLHPSHITLNPPPDRRRAIERFGFTQVFEEDASQLDVFHCTDTSSLIEGVLAPQGGEGTDAVVATLGVTGSGKTHTILGSRNQRGLTQLAVDVIFRSISENMVESAQSPTLDSLQACDPSEATLVTATHFLDSANADPMQTSRGGGSRSTTPMMGESSLIGSSQRRTLRRHSTLLSSLPHSPDVSDFVVPCDPAAEYVVVVSMYEVHNDRIYDLLTPAGKPASTKDYRRRPLLFKPTELSPDRKVVAGLRKVVCTDVREAILVLETGLQERRVAGTGSNSVSSRSHGFFCFEVKKRSFGWKNNSWSGSKLTIVDLAGSERARDAKTQGATLVEAGKINESLMYLGQCLQTQSEASSGRPNVVPYRQCKLTEILFSNSFPSASASYTHIPRRTPQRGVMIVTADPLGDFNATSQILRYSALARDVTVARAPSITATILAQAGPTHGAPHTPRPFGNAGFGSQRSHFSPVNATDERVTMEIAALEIARMSDEIDQLRDEIEVQSEARIAAEAHLLSTEDRMIDMEAAVREECALEFEQRLAVELARFKASMQIEKERHEEHWDRKVDILERGLDTGFEDFDKENVLVENLTQEVERLRRENAILKRELASRSPSKRKPLEEREDFSVASGSGASSSKHDGVSSLGRKLERMKVSNDGAWSGHNTNGGSPKKVRRLVARRWEDSDDL
ncbi:kinesin [Trichoderma ceciliae]